MAEIIVPNLDNLLDPTVLNNPYPLYAQLRSKEPVHWNSIMRSWFTSSHADISAILHDPQRFSSEITTRRNYAVPLTLEDQAAVDRFFAFLGMFMQAADQPRHTRLRGLVNRAFTPRALERMKTSIQRMVDHYLDEAQEAGQMELISHLAHPLPATVIAELLGVPPEGRALFKASSASIAAFLGIMAPAPGQMVELEKPIVEISVLLRQLIAERRKKPQDDLISAMVMKDEHGEVLSEEEIVVACTLLLFAGHETTTNLLGNGLVALLQHPAQLQKLRENPALLANAVEEMLRYDSPVQGVSRRPKVTVELGGKKIEPGQVIWIMLGAANRDPAVFSDPDSFNIERTITRPLGFGYGIHFCLGAALARIEAQITIGSLLQRFPNLQLATAAVEWRPNFALRGLKALPLTW